MSVINILENVAKAYIFWLFIYTEKNLTYYKDVLAIC